MDSTACPLPTTNFKGVGISFFHDLLSNRIEPIPTQCSSMETLDMSPIQTTTAIKKAPLAQDFDRANGSDDLDQNRGAVGFKDVDYDNNH